MFAVGNVNGHDIVLEAKLVHHDSHIPATRNQSMVSNNTLHRLGGNYAHRARREHIAIEGEGLSVGQRH